MTSTGARSIAVLILLAMAALYYSDGARFQLWPDSAGYLGQALGLAGDQPYARPGGRSVGYPLLVAIALKTPAPLLTVFLLQLLLAGLAYAAVYLALTCWAWPALGMASVANRRARAVAAIAVALATLYSAVHVQAGALLTEILFAVLALAGVLATIAFARLDPGTPQPHLKAALAAVVAGAALLVKPHWLLAAGVLGAAIAIQLWRLTRRAGGATAGRFVAAIVALAVPAVTITLITLPDRMLGARYNQREEALFGPRVAFCNHLHLIDATLHRRPSLRLQENEPFEASLRAYFKDVQQRRGGGWRRLGFDGDLCSLDSGFSRMLDARFPDAGAQASFLLGAVAKSALAEPWPYMGKVARHMVYGVTSAFERFAMHARPGIEALDGLKAALPLPPGFARGVWITESIGPFAAEETLKRTWSGRAVHGALAVVFFGLTGLLWAAVLLGLAAPVIWWRSWIWDARRAYLTYVAIPLAAILGHHAVVALTHSFDVWRYAFNMFFVNLLLVGTGVMLALRLGRRRLGL